MSYKRYWWALAIVIVGSFMVLGGEGRKMISGAPPLADVYTTDGQLLFTGSSITDGQGVWQSIGGQEIGTVWGHGAYVAPDWSADWLHRESEILLNSWAVRDGAPNFAALSVDQQAVFKARLIREMRTNTYDASPIASPSTRIAPLHSRSLRPIMPMSSPADAPNTLFRAVL